MFFRPGQGSQKDMRSANMTYVGPDVVHRPIIIDPFSFTSASKSPTEPGHNWAGEELRYIAILAPSSLETIRGCALLISVLRDGGHLKER